jgi:TolA-binding protein
MKHLKLLLLTVIILLFTGCAFFNTLYNGWQAYNTGLATEEKMLREGSDSTEINTATLSNYEKAILKAEKAVEYYPRSVNKHDDAYYLKGLAQYKKGEYSLAISAFKVVHHNYPESKKVPHSWLMLGKSYAANGDFIEADETYTFVIDNYPELNENLEVSILRADLAIELRGKSQAILFLEESLESMKEPEKQVYLINRLAGLYMGLAMFDKAIEKLELLPKFHRKYLALYYEAQSKQIRCYRELGQIENALDKLDEALKNSHYLYKRDELSYLKGVVLADDKKFDDAYEMFESVSSGTGDDDIRAKSWFEMSNISIDERADLIIGKEELTNAAELSKDEEFLAIVQKRLDGLTLVADLQDSLLENSSRDTVKESSYWEYRIGESYWLDTKLPDSAIFYFDKIINDTTSADSVRSIALFSKAWIINAMSEDSLRADSIFNEIIKQYPATDVAKESQKLLNLEVTIMTHRDSALVRFEEAEKLGRQSDGYSKDVYYSYLITALKYKDVDEVAAKSLYAAGFEINSRRSVEFNEDSLVVDTAAVKIFNRLCDNYPESEQCISAQNMLESGLVKGYIQIHEEKLSDNENDSLITTDSTDTDDKNESSKPVMPSFEDWF